MSRTTIRPPQQARSRASFERVLDAGAALLGEKGYEGFTLSEVSKRSKVSVGSIYARVASKDDLFHAIHERLMEQMMAQLEDWRELERWEGVPTPSLIETVIREFADGMRANQALLGVIMHRAAVDEAVAARSSATLLETSRLFAAQLLSRRDEISHPAPELATDVVFRLTFSTLSRQVMYGPTFESARLVPWDRLVAELGQVALRYLGVPTLDAVRQALAS